MLNLGRHGGWVYFDKLEITKEASKTKVDYHIINVAVTVASSHVTSACMCLFCLFVLFSYDVFVRFVRRFDCFFRVNRVNRLSD